LGGRVPRPEGLERTERAWKVLRRWAVLLAGFL
jgi:hypothetical protein